MVQDIILFITYAFGEYCSKIEKLIALGYFTKAYK
jgi:hypothetical protein